MGQIQFSSIQRLKKCIFLTKTGELHSGNKFFGDGNFLISGQVIHHKFSTSQINQHHKNLRTWVQFLAMGIFWSQVKKFTIKCFFQSEKTPPPSCWPKASTNFLWSNEWSRLLLSWIPLITPLERKYLLWIPGRWEFFDLRPRNSP